MKHNQKQKHYLHIVIPVFLLILGAQAVINYYFYRQQQRSHDSTIISMINLAVEGLHKPAPVDPKTGDTYLPEAHLMIPDVADSPQILYSYTSTNTPPQMSITSNRLLSIGESKLWSAYSNNLQHSEGDSMKAVFDSVPKLQACSRGVQMFTQAQTDKGYVERFKVTSGNTTWYAYTEKNCSYYGLDPLVAQLRQMKAY